MICSCPHSWTNELEVLDAESLRMTIGSISGKSGVSGIPGYPVLRLLKALVNASFFGI
jgi:hypothetical protein